MWNQLSKKIKAVTFVTAAVLAIGAVPFLGLIRSEHVIRIPHLIPESGSMLILGAALFVVAGLVRRLPRRSSFRQWLSVSAVLKSSD